MVYSREQPRRPAAETNPAALSSMVTVTANAGLLMAQQASTLAGPGFPDFRARTIFREGLYAVTKQHLLSLMTIYDLLYKAGPVTVPATSWSNRGLYCSGVAWRNVEKAINNLKNTGNMDFKALLHLDEILYPT